MYISAKPDVGHAAACLIAPLPPHTLAPNIRETPHAPKDTPRKLAFCIPNRPLGQHTNNEGYDFSGSWAQNHSSRPGRTVGVFNLQRENRCTPTFLTAAHKLARERCSRPFFPFSPQDHVGKKAWKEIGRLFLGSRMNVVFTLLTVPISPSRTPLCPYRSDTRWPIPVVTG